MAANSSDMFTEVGSPGTATTLAAPGHTIGGSAFTVVSTSNWPTTTGAFFAVDTYTLQTVNGVSTAVRTPGSYTEWEGVIASSTSITGAVLRYGTDQNYPAGSTTRVYIPVASSRENRLVQGLTTAVLDQDGTMKAGAVDNAAALASNVVTTAKILDANVTFAKLLSTIFSGQVTTYTNPGTAGGTSSFFYINLGGIKLLWGTTAAVSVGTGGTTSTVTLPTSFFSSIQLALPGLGPLTTSANQSVHIETTPSTTTVTLGHLSGSNGSSQVVELLVIGT